jgi:hypothetical protein
MPATINGGGDVLARGGVRATFRNADVTQEKWDAIWGEPTGPKKNYSGDADSAQTGVPGSGARKTRRSKKAK